VSTEPFDQVAPGVTRIVAPIPFPEPDHVNCYLLATVGGSVLVDTGMRGSERAIDAALRALDATVDRVLIAGDHLLPAVTPNIHLTTEMPDAVADYLASLRRVAALEVSLVLPGHGEPFRDAAARAHDLIAHHERRLTTLESLLAHAGQADTSELAERLFRHVGRPADRLLAEMETYAHLEHLRLRGRVVLADTGTWRLGA
jgi:glyoxylase-like metal-dependent hydrolase (beta-lactamase superfamily II)